MSDEVHPVDSPEAAESVPQRSGPRSLLKKVFVGPRGLRAGWKVLIFVLILFAVSFCLRPLRKLSGPVNRELPVPPGTALLYELPRVLAVLIATGIMARWIDRKPWGYFGMPLGNAFRSSFWIGAASGLGVLALQLEIMHVCGWFDYGTVQLRGRIARHQTPNTKRTGFSLVSIPKESCVPTVSGSIHVPNRRSQTEKRSDRFAV